MLVEQCPICKNIRNKTEQTEMKIIFWNKPINSLKNAYAYKIHLHCRICKKDFLCYIELNRNSDNNHYSHIDLYLVTYGYVYLCGTLFSVDEFCLI